MIRMWLETLSRKVMSGRRLRNPVRPLWRRGISLRLEALEDRTVTSTFGVDAPGLTTPTTSPAPPSGISSPATNTAGLDNLIQAMRQDPASATVASSGLNLDFFPSISKVVADADATFSASIVVGSPRTASFTSNLTIALNGTATGTATTVVEGAGKTAVPATGLTLTVGTANNSLAEGVAVALRDVLPPRAQPQVGSGDVSGGHNDQVGARLAPETVGGYTVASRATLDNGAALQARPIGSMTLDFATAADNVQVARAGASAAPMSSPGLSIVAENGSARGVAEAQAVHPALDGSAANAGGLVGSMMRPPVEEAPDAALLQRFATQREQAAFTALVQRHSRFVLGICQRVLGDTHAAEDVFQATFMILARKANMLDRRHPLAGWLYKVAYHLALRVRAVKARQRQCEWQATAGSERADESAAADLEQQELRRAVNEELQRLPEKYRVPLVMCYFDGRTHEEAAREMGLPRGSMAKRIGEGLQRLRERLVGRGLVL